jgi:hypothetical protein
MSQLKRESFDENDGDDIRSLSIVGSEYTLETLSIGTKNENSSVATSDFVQLDQPDEVPGQQEEQQQGDAEQQANYQVYPHDSGSLDQNNWQIKGDNPKNALHSKETSKSDGTTGGKILGHN